MERLTTHWMDGTYDTYDPVDIADNDYSRINYQKLLTKLGEYEDAEEQGLLLRLPCKVGDTVYNIRWWDCERESVKVDGKTYFREVRKPKISKEKFSLFDYKDFGKSVFLTKEEAEQALKEGVSNV